MRALATITLAAAVVWGSATPAAGADFELADYRGAHYTPAAKAFLECAALRESSGRWRADGPYGSGAFQIIGRTWAHYATLAGYPEWAGKRAATAPPYVQTEVAYVMVNPHPKRKGLEGRHHWSPRHALTIGKRIEAC